MACQEAGSKVRLEGKDKVLSQPGLVPESCYVDQLSFSDTDDDSYLTCVKESCPTALEHQFKAFTQIGTAAFLLWFGAPLTSQCYLPQRPRQRRLP
eukprot:SAG31_NODE_3818_length_3853_cov_10.567395_5_plen_96_part_00